MPLVVLACLAYVSMSLPDSALGIAWPSMSADFRQPLAALGWLLVFGVAASVLASTMTGRILARIHIGWLLSGSTLLSAIALACYSLAPSLWAVVAATVLLGLASGAVDSGLNAYAARRFGARHITWMHASYGLGAIVGPMTVTVALSTGLHWRGPYAVIAAAQALLAWAFFRTAHRWAVRADALPPAVPTRPAGGVDCGRRPAGSRRYVTALSTAIFALETGIESGVGLWAYVFLTEGRDLPPATAGLVLSGYWATMCVGRIILGPVAERVGPALVLACSVAGVTAAAAAMTVPGPTALVLVGVLVLGLAAAPMFPLLTLTTAERLGHGDTDRTIGFQVAASTIGGAALPAGMGLLIQRLGANALGPTVLALALVMAIAYYGLARLTPRGNAASASIP
jgi:fucose permease